MSIPHCVSKVILQLSLEKRILSSELQDLSQHCRSSQLNTFHQPPYKIAFSFLALVWTLIEVVLKRILKARKSKTITAADTNSKRKDS